MSSLKVPELKALLKRHGHSTSGLKADLVARCHEYNLFSLQNDDDKKDAINYSHKTAAAAMKRPIVEDYHAISNKRQKEDQVPAAAAAASNSFELAALQLFREIQGPGEENAELDGLVLCDALKVDPESLRAIALSYYLGSKKLGSFPQTDFVQAVARERIRSLSELAARLPEWEERIRFPRGEDFDRVYAYTFQWGIKLSKEEKMDLWQVLVPQMFFPQMSLWREFWASPERKKIGKDDWNSFPRLVQVLLRKNVSVENAGLDEDSWPTAYLDFVDFARERNPT